MDEARWERIERNIEFLSESAARNEARHTKHESEMTDIRRELDRIVGVMGSVVDRQNQMDEALATLVDAQIRTEERFRQTDERIDDLVRAIAEKTERYTN